MNASVYPPSPGLNTRDGKKNYSNQNMFLSSKSSPGSRSKTQGSQRRKGKTGREGGGKWGRIGWGGERRGGVG